MPKEPLVSAVIITYNQEKYIEQTIECALAQKVNFPYEIIIGEDCSTDKTREICLRYQERYPDKIKVVTSSKNIGLLGNYYRAVLASHGKYIAVCAGDDYWHNPEKIQKQVKYLEENIKCGMVHSDENTLFEDTGEIIENYNQRSKIHSKINNPKETLRLLFAGNYRIVASSSMYRKYYFDNYFDIEELDAHGIVMEDMPLWLILAIHSQIHYIPESLVTRRVVQGSVSRQAFEKKIALWQSAYNCYLYFYEKYKDKLSDTNIDIKMIHRLFNFLMFRTAYKANRKKAAQSYYLEIINLAGDSYVRPIDRFRYYMTHIPFGIPIHNWLFGKYRHLYESITGIPQRDI